jgi:hypothetical protein
MCSLILTQVPRGSLLSKNITRLGSDAATDFSFMFSKLKSLDIQFIARDKLSYEIWPKPILAAANKPEWYSQLVPYTGGKLSIITTNATGNSTLNAP